MSYLEIFIVGWNLNALMFVINFLLVIRVIRTNSREDLKEQSKILSALKSEFDRYYPYRKYTTLISYIIPFTAFFRMSYRLLEMSLFFVKNKGSSMYDYMQYRYQYDINLAKEKQR